MIPIAPLDIARQFQPGQKVKLGTLCDIARGKNQQKNHDPAFYNDEKHRNRNPLKKSNFVLISKINPTSKHWYQNTCHCAGGKCDRCKAKGCADRDWRKRGLDVP
jgi:hypothetical protein